MAFQDTLPDTQRVVGLEMMAEMSQVLSRRGRFPSLEAGYWVDVLIEENSLKEYTELTERLEGEARRGPIAVLRRANMRLRRRQLLGALKRLRQRIEDAEEALSLGDGFHARRQEPTSR